MNNNEKMKQLVSTLNQWAYEYYVLDNPTVSDAKYDQLYDELVLLEKQTGIVLAVVVVFLVVLMGFDALLSWLYKLLVEGLNAGTTASLTSGVGAFFSGVGAPLWL